MVTSEMIKDLRSQTGAGFLDCKKALVETNGDMDKAVSMLREKGLAAAAKKADRVAAEGIVESYIHGNGRIGVLVEVNCETDFVAKNDNFKAFVHDIAMHIAASNPRFLHSDEVPAELVAQEKDILLKQAINEGKNPEIAEKIVIGRMDKFFKEICLLDQPFVKDPDITVNQLVQQQIAHFGENITVRRFVCFIRGEGLEKKADDFAAEVARMQNQ